MQWNNQSQSNRGSEAKENDRANRPVNYYQAEFSAFFKKNLKKLLLWIGIFILLLVLVNECTFVVGESEQAVVSQFGVIKRMIIHNHNDFHAKYAEQLQGEITTSGTVAIQSGIGLQFKIPFIDRVEKLSSQLFTYISDSEVVNTREKKQYYITTYAQWHISDPALFNLKLGSMVSAENQLDNIIHPVIVQAINRMDGDDFISNKDALNSALTNGLRLINADMCIRGIEVVDIQIHRTILPTANVESTYARMQADRAKVAQQLRSEGNEAYNKAVAATDLEARQLEAVAFSQAGIIRGEGDAKAAEIYASAYGADPEFYTFWQSILTLKHSIKANTTLVLDETSPFFQILLQQLRTE